MNKRINLALAAALAGIAGFAISTSDQAAAGTHNCAALGNTSDQVASLYSDVSSVKPVHEDVFLARAITRKFVSGAAMYVPGQKDMNEVYLNRLMACHAASNAAPASPNDPVRVQGVDRVDVEAVGGNFRITVTGQDRDSARNILKTAEQLQQSSVQVRQL